jgi:hypothetical protein
MSSLSVRGTKELDSHFRAGEGLEEPKSLLSQVSVRLTPEQPGVGEWRPNKAIHVLCAELQCAPGPSALAGGRWFHPCAPPGPPGLAQLRLVHTGTGMVARVTTRSVPAPKEAGLQLRKATGGRGPGWAEPLPFLPTPDPSLPG